MDVRCMRTRSDPCSPGGGRPALAPWNSTIEVLPMSAEDLVAAEERARQCKEGYNTVADAKGRSPSSRYDVGPSGSRRVVRFHLGESLIS